MQSSRCPSMGELKFDLRVAVMCFGDGEDVERVRFNT